MSPKGRRCRSEKSPDVARRNAQPSNPTKAGAAGFVVHADKAGPAPNTSGSMAVSARKRKKATLILNVAFTSVGNDLRPLIPARSMGVRRAPLPTLAYGILAQPFGTTCSQFSHQHHIVAVRAGCGDLPALASSVGCQDWA